MENVNNTEVNTNQEVINKVILTGFMGRDPELNTVGNNLKVAKFSVATNNNYKNGKGELVKETHWHNIVLWGKLATDAESQLKKGAKVKIVGKISYRMFTDKNGIKKQFTDIIGNTFEILESKAA